MYEALLVVFLLIAMGLVGLILLQQGKGAAMGASFGAGASATLFGSSGSGNFMTRATAILGMLFFVISLILGNLTSHHVVQGDKWDNLTQPKEVKTKVAEPIKTDPSTTKQADRTTNNTDVPN